MSKDTRLYVKPVLSTSKSCTYDPTGLTKLGNLVDGGAGQTREYGVHGYYFGNCYNIFKTSNALDCLNDGIGPYGCHVYCYNGEWDNTNDSSGSASATRSKYDADNYLGLEDTINGLELALQNPKLVPMKDLIDAGIHQAFCVTL